MVTWLDIAGFPGYYVSDDGHVLSCVRRKPRVLKPEIDKDGYRRVVLVRNGKNHHRIISRLVQAFVGDAPPDKPMALHWNGDVSNNRVSNLYWGDATINAADRGRHGRTYQGEPHHLARLTEDDVRRIRVMISLGCTNAYIAAQFGVTNGNIWFIRKGRTWKSVAA